MHLAPGNLGAAIAQIAPGLRCQTQSDAFQQRCMTVVQSPPCTQSGAAKTISRNTGRAYRHVFPNRHSDALISNTTVATTSVSSFSHAAKNVNRSGICKPSYADACCKQIRMTKFLMRKQHDISLNTPCTLKPTHHTISSGLLLSPPHLAMSRRLIAVPQIKIEAAASDHCLESAFAARGSSIMKGSVSLNILHCDSRWRHTPQKQLRDNDFSGHLRKLPWAGLFGGQALHHRWFWHWHEKPQCWERLGTN